MAKVFQVDTGGTLTTGLISYWPLEEPSGLRPDFFGSNDLTDNNTVTGAVGKVNNAAQFTRANGEWLSHADNASLSINGSSFSLAGWVYLDSKPAVANMTICARTGPNGNTLGVGDREFDLLYVDTVGKFYFQIYDGSGLADAVQATTFGAPSTGTWYFLVAIHDIVAQKIYISVNNGTLDSTSTTKTTIDSTADFSLGNRNQFGIGDAWDGREDEFGLWKKVLSAQEITDLYNGGVGQTMVLSSTVHRMFAIFD